MNSAFPSSGRQLNPPLQPEWQRQLQAWRDLLDPCALRPTRKCVHALRSLTLRLRTSLEFRLKEQAAEPAAERAFNRWNREGKKLRRALEPVRDADVFLARLAALREARPSEAELSPRCLRQMGKLEDRLKQQRRKGVGRLMAAMEARRKRLRRLSEEMESALPPRMASGAGSTAEAASRIFAALAADLPGLDSANLHAFRKRLKQALYLAEISAAADRAAKRLSVALRKMHGSIGEWHDWQMLSSEARRVLDGRARQDGLVALLDGQAEEALTRSLVICSRITAEFLKSSAAIPPRLRPKPVARVTVPFPEEISAKLA